MEANFMIRRGVERRSVMLGLATAAALPSLSRAQGAGKTVISHGIAIHGTPETPPDAKHLAYVNPNAPKGGTIKLAGRGTFDSLNPFILKGTPAGAVGLIYETLLGSHGDEASTGYGLLAETIEVPSDRSWVIFKLRAEARWHDGKPVTPEDVVFSFDILKEKGAPSYATYWQDVKKAEKVDERSVKFTFGGGENHELPNIIGQLPVLPKHWWATREFDRTSLEIPLGSGPYRVDSLEAARHITMRRVEDYWGRDLWLNKGRFNFDIVRYDYYRDEQVSFEAFKGGQIDYRDEATTRLWATAYDFPAVKSGAVKMATMPHGNVLPMQGIIFNLRNERFRDRRFREAFIHLVDFEWFNKTLTHGLLTRVNSFFFNSELAATGLPSKEELEILEPLRGQIPPEVFDKEYRLPVTDGSGNNRDGARRAIGLLKEAGWEIRNGKMTNLKSGQPLSFELLLGEPRLEQFGLPFKQWCDRVGVEVRLRTVDPVQYQKRMDSFDYEATIDLFPQSLSPGNEQREFWGSKAADTQGSRNTIGIKDPAVEKLIELVISAPDRQSLIVRTRALDRVLLWNQFVVPQYRSTVYWVAYWDKFGRPEKLAKYSPRGWTTWWIDAEKERTLSQRAPERKT
jgi:microcin C transport system substrate-binding protein